LNWLYQNEKLREKAHKLHTDPKLQFFFINSNFKKINLEGKSVEKFDFLFNCKSIFCTYLNSKKKFGNFFIEIEFMHKNWIFGPLLV